MSLQHDVVWLWEEKADNRNVYQNKKKYCSCCITLIRIDTILSKNIYNDFQNLLFRKLPVQSGDQTDIFWKFYLPTDIVWLPKTVRWVLGYTTDVIIYLNIVSSMGKRTSTCLMYNCSYKFPYNDNKMIYEYYIKVQSIDLFKQSQVFRYTLCLHDVQKLVSVPTAVMAGNDTF